HRVPHSFPTRRSSDLYRLTVPAALGSISPEPLVANGSARHPAAWRSRWSWLGAALACAAAVAGVVVALRGEAPSTTGISVAVLPDRKSTRLNSSHVKI